VASEKWLAMLGNADLRGGDNDKFDGHGSLVDESGAQNARLVIVRASNIEMLSNYTLGEKLSGV
jgi:hypothetical protein